MRTVISFAAPTLYVLAVLVLIQFVSVRLVLGFYETSASTTVVPSNTNRTSLAQDKKASKRAPAINGIPVRILIPRIRVNAAIQPVGLTSDGSMGVPKLPLDTVWYKFGPKPGEKGSAVISGHVNWWYGAKGVFERLNVLKTGDKIDVQNEGGATTTFVVRNTRVFDQKDDASDVFRSYDGKSHLNLVTCSGVWNKATRSYSKRLVVFAEKVGE